MNILAGFFVPLEITQNAWSFLYLVPLVLLISIVYKTTKINEVTAGLLAKEVLLLTGSILVFMIAVAAGLYGLFAFLLK